MFPYRLQYSLDFPVGFYGEIIRPLIGAVVMTGKGSCVRLKSDHKIT